VPKRIGRAFLHHPVDHKLQSFRNDLFVHRQIGFDFQVGVGFLMLAAEGTHRRDQPQVV
jgi:hypothetical protein